MLLSWSGTQFIVPVRHRTYCPVLVRYTVYGPDDAQTVLLSWKGTAYCPDVAQNMFLSWSGTQGQVQNVLAWYTLYCPDEAQNMLLFWSGTQCIVLVRYTMYCPVGYTACYHPGQKHNVLSWPGPQVMYMMYCPGPVCKSCRQHTVLVRYTCYCPGQVRKVFP